MSDTLSSALAMSARAGRTRWKVENELFNVIKNKGYHLEHSYGHGKQFLCSTLGGLMLLAFLIDEIQEALLPAVPGSQNHLSCADGTMGKAASPVLHV